MLHLPSFLFLPVFSLWQRQSLVPINFYKYMKTLFSSCFLLILLSTSNCFADAVLVTIGDSGKVTEQQLESALQAAPFASQFPAMDEKDQAYLRGDLLLRLARAEALYQEAVDQKIPESSLFQQEMSNFKTALLAQRYLLQLSQNIQIPESVEKQFKENTQGQTDALKAARSAYIAQHFKKIKQDKIAQLRQQAGLQTFYDRLDKQPATDTILASANNLEIRYGDLVPENAPSKPDKKQIQDKVEEWIDLTLLAKAAEQQGIDINAQLQDFGHNLAIRILLAEQEKQWIPDENTLLDYFQKHPKIGYIPERRQIGQIVLSSQEDAEKMLQRIQSGESLFELAGQYSIDPYGRQRSGDMGWLTEGSASPAIEEALKSLKDNEISPIIKTDKGWHIITIVSRKPSENKDFNAIKDRVRQKLIAEKMAAYLKYVTNKYPLQWHIPDSEKQL